MVHMGSINSTCKGYFKKKTKKKKLTKPLDLFTNLQEIVQMHMLKDIMKIKLGKSRKWETVHDKQLSFFN